MRQSPAAQAVSSTSRRWHWPQPHWPRLPRLSRHSHAERAAKKAAAKFRAETKLQRQKSIRHGERPQGEKSFLLRMLAPQFLLEVLRILTQSAAQVRLPSLQFYPASIETSCIRLQKCACLSLELVH